MIVEELEQGIQTQTLNLSDLESRCDELAKESSELDTAVNAFLDATNASESQSLETAA